MLDVLKMNFQDVIAHFETYPSIRMVSETSYIRSICIISTDGLLLWATYYKENSSYYSHIRHINDTKNDKKLKNFLTDYNVYEKYLDIKVINKDESEIDILNNFKSSNSILGEVFLLLESLVRKRKIERLLNIQ